MNEPRLAMIRQLSAVAQADVMPPESANLVFAQMVKGRVLLLKSLCDRQRDKAVPLTGLVFLGENHNRWTAHGGMAPNKLPRLVLTHELAPIAAADRGRTGSGTRCLSARPQAWDVAGVIAHEAVHEAQFNTSPALDTSTHPRAGFLEAARRLKWGGADCGGDLIMYVSDPLEVQAYLEEVHVHELLAGKTGMPSFSFAPEIGMDEFAGMLDELADTLKTDGKSMAPSADRSGMVAQFDPAWYPGIGGLMERILLSTAMLHTATCSQAWNRGVTEHWRNTLAAMKDRVDEITMNSPRQEDVIGFAAALEDFIADRPRRNALHALELIADTLEVFLHNLERSYGHVLHLPKGERISEEAFVAGKNDPAAMLQGVLEQAGYAHAHCVGNAIANAKAESGFSEGVARLEEAIRNGEGVSRDDVCETVVRLAARLLGLDASQIPPGLMPEVHLYDAPSAVLPELPGLNGVKHQARKASFDVAAWQFLVPIHTFDEPGRLGPRLARLAADMAYAAAMLHVVGDVDLMNNPRFVHSVHTLWYGPLSARFIDFLAKGEAAKASRQFVESKPDCAAAALRAMVREPEHEDCEARVWHLGLRADMKHTWKNAVSSLGPQETMGHSMAAAALEARSVYEARTYRRWQTRLVAFRRAVGEL
ncbi:MAG: hypothetical protein JF606_24555 [Burkholderiales bacterium]|nr:hypothetical protein [Burkholderiales bacterium]